MADKKFTLLELHMHGDAQFGPKTITGGGDDEAADEDADESDDDKPWDEADAPDVHVESGGPGNALVGLVVLVVVVFVIKKLLGGGDEDEEDLDLED